TTYLNNFWVVGSPDGSYGYYDEQCIADFEKDRINDPDYYNVYALGEWGVLRTGSEFFGSFNRGQHCREVKYDPRLPIHLSVDNNVLPYISFTFWQVDTSNGYDIRQIDEICAESPNNTVRKAAKLVAERIKQYNPEAVYLHGDASTRAANNIDEEKRSWLDLLIDCLAKEGVEVVDCVGNKNPSVPLSGEFINAIYDFMLPRISIIIGENCKVSIEDYMGVQKDVNGGILKTRVKNKITMQTYEEHGHISDTKRYVIVDILKDEFTMFSNQRKRNIYARDGFIKYFNPDTENAYTADILYLLPNVKNKVVYLHGKRCGNSWHIVSAKIEETISLDTIKEYILTENADVTVLECPDSYFSFVRELRTILPNVRVKREGDDIAKRVAATSDIVRDRVLFNPNLVESDDGYSQFLTNMLDYGKDSEIIEASATISGFIQFAEKWISR
ncbi:MAG: PBSX family phage terminase large subunit, partial [Muribaculum sp.]|nr:PBSX family phage terminase large subunit [Muribaculum sp.]